MALDQFIFQQQRMNISSFRLQAQLTTGQAIIFPSDNPLLASRLLRFTETEERQEQILENIRFASNFLDAADAAMTGVTDSVIRAQELASGAVSTIALPAEREAAAIEIDSIIEQLMTTANRQHLGLYLFGGREVETAPVVGELGGIHYVGDTGELRSRVAEDGDDQFNLTADDVFNMLSTRVEGSVDLDPAITERTRLDQLQGARGVGITLGSLRFVESGVAGSYTVDLSSATTVGQIIDLINAAATAAGSTLVASIDPSGDGLLITPGDAVTVAELDNTVARDLGISATTEVTAPIVGLDLNRMLTNTTAIADLFGGAGIDFAGETFRIRNGALSASIDLTPAQTVQDILNIINSSEVGVRARINAQADGIDIINEVSGTVMTIEEEGGTVAARLGIRTMNTTTALADLNFGNGVRRIDGADDLQFVAKDGSAIAVNLDSAETIQDVLDLINAAAVAAGVNLEASLATTGNGIRIVDSTGGAGGLRITRLNFSFALEDLGLDVNIDATATEVAGDDTGGVRVDGLFTALLDLREALLRGDEQDITDAAGRVDEAQKDVTRIQGIVGAEVRAMEARADRTQQAVDATAILLSEVRDLDFVAAISRFQQLQTSLQASLLASSQTLNLSLLNFL